MNIVKIIRTLRDIKILMKNSLMTHEVKHEIRHADKNVIDLEDTIDEDAVEIEDEPSGDEE